MTTTTRRSLPYTVAALRSDWLPPEPDGTAVTVARAAQIRVWAAVTEAQTDVDQLVADEHDAVVALVDQAIAGQPIDQAVADLGRDTAVPAARHRLELLHQAHSAVSARLNAAQLTDPDYVDWRATCRQIEDDCHRAWSSDDPTKALIELLDPQV